MTEGVTTHTLFMPPRQLCLALGLLFVTACQTPTNDITATADAAEPQFPSLTGTYVRGPLALTTVGEYEGRLSIQPPFWGSRPYLDQTAENLFIQALPHRNPERTVAFEPDTLNGNTSLTFNNYSRDFDRLSFERLVEGEQTPASLFYAHRPEAAAQQLAGNPEVSASEIAGFAVNILSEYPSRTDDTVKFLETYLDLTDGASGIELASALGYGYLKAGQRKKATQNFQNALQSNPDDFLPRFFLDILQTEEPAPGKGYRKLLPYGLSQVFQKPTPDEIERVSSDWASRELIAEPIKAVATEEILVEDTPFIAEVLGYAVGSERHFGVLLTAKGATEPLPVLIDARGVNPEFTSMDISTGTELMAKLGAMKTSYAYLVPAMNGHEMILKGKSYLSEGDPSDAWDGATDSTLGLLDAALKHSRRINKKKVAIYGHSRGGTVAFLSAIRDNRISLVLSVAGPTDHFEAMQTVEGVRWEELLRTDMADGTGPRPGTPSSQKFDHFLADTVDKGEDLTAVRHKILASSPLYFAHHLPETHAYYGRDDTSVPVANAEGLEEALTQSGHIKNGSTVTIYDNVGHDTDVYRSAMDMKRILARWTKEQASP